MSLSPPLQNNFLTSYWQPSALSPQVLEPHERGFHRTSLCCSFRPWTTVTPDLSVHGITDWGAWWGLQKSSRYTPPLYRGRNWGQGSPRLHWARDSQPLSFPLCKATFYNSSLDSELSTAHSLSSQFSASHDRDKVLEKSFNWCIFSVTGCHSEVTVS